MDSADAPRTRDAVALRTSRYNHYRSTLQATHVTPWGQELFQPRFLRDPAIAALSVAKVSFVHEGATEGCERGIYVG